MHVPTNRQLFRFLPLALVLGVSLFATGFWLVKPLTNPDAGDYAAAARVIRDGFRDHDAVAIRPWWAARIREHAGNLPFLQVRDLPGEDLSHYARLWVVLLPGHDDGLSGKYALEEEVDTGSLTVRRYRLGEPVPIRFDFRERLEHAQVRMHQGNSWKPCSKWVTDRWVCSGRDWNFVGRMVVELGDDPRAVIWAHPSDTGPIEVTYPDVPGGRTLRVRTGFTPPGARTPEGAPVTLEVFMDGRELGQVTQDNRTGYFPHDFDITPSGPGPHTVTFRISAPHVGMRHFCFDGEVRG